MRRDVRRDTGARHLYHRTAPRGDRLLPAHDRRRGAHVRGRQDPRRVLPPRGSPVRDGDPDGQTHRPPDAAELQGRLPRRGPGRDLRALGRHGAPVRHRGHERREPRDDAVGDPVRGPGRFGPDGPDRRRVGHQPHVPGPRGVHVRHRGGRPPQRRRAGRHPDDRGRGAREHLGAPAGRRHDADRAGCRRGPRGGQARDRRADRDAARVRRHGRRQAQAVRAQAALRGGHVGGRRDVQGASRDRDRARPDRARGRDVRDQGPPEGPPARDLGRGDLRLAPVRRSRRHGRTCRRRSCGPA